MSIFEKILAGEIPGNIVYQNEMIFVLIDVNPKRLGHSLIIPKKQKNNLLEENETTISEIYKVAKKLAPIYQDVLKAKGFKLNTNINKEAKQVVFHTHVHFIPYYDDYDDFSHVMIDDKTIKILKAKLNEL